MSKSILYAANTNNQTVAIGGVVNFGSVVRRYGSNVYMSGGNVICNGSGYYDVEVNISVTPAASGNITVQLYKDGTAIPGAEQTITVVGAELYAINIPAVIREACCCESTITAVISGVAGVVTNAAIKVEKL